MPKIINSTSIGNTKQDNSKVVSKQPIKIKLTPEQIAALEKKKYEDSEGKYKLFAPKEEQYFFLTVEILISGKFYKRNYIIENDNIKKIKENSYLYFDDKIIMKMLESGKYQKLTF